ncbi:MAG: glycosyltransferase [Pirellulaceae bacterium]
MKTSLSVILPVSNAQSRLAADVERLLEMLPEVTRRFEILIIDDGSTDLTEEVAYELSCQYPQVRARRNSYAAGKATAIDIGMKIAKGEVVMIQDAHNPLSLEDIRALWSMQGDLEKRQPIAPIAELPTAQPLDTELLRSLSAWGAEVHRLKRSEEMDPTRKVRQPEIASAESAARRGPNFLRRIQKFALGE